MKAVIYCRVSTKEQVENLSLATQEQECRRYCAQNGLEVAKVFVDKGESAKTANRPQLIAMMEHCRKNKGTISSLVVYKVDRLARNQQDHHGLAAVLRSFGVQLHSATQPIDDSPTGKAMEGMLSVFAQLDNDTRAERTRAGMKAALMEGRWCRKPPLGYAKPPKVQRPPSLIIDSEPARLIRIAFERIADGNVTMRDTLGHVTALGLRTKSGKKVGTTSFQTLLRNPVYIGQIRSKKHGLTVPGDFPPIVSEELFRRAQAALSGNSNNKATHKRARAEFPLRGTLVCSECSRKLTASRSRGNGGEYEYYRCPNKCVKAPVADLHRQYVDLLARLSPSAGMLRLWREVVLDAWNLRDKQAQVARKRISDKLDKQKQRKNRLVDLLVDGKVDDETYREQVHRIDAQIGELRLELDKAQSKELDIEGLLGFAEHALQNAARMWQGFNLEQRQRFQAVLFPDGLTFDGEKVGTTTISPVFKLLQPNSESDNRLASPTGFEPVSPA